MANRKTTPANTTPANTTPANTTPANTTPANTTPEQETPTLFVASSKSTNKAGAVEIMEVDILTFPSVLPTEVSQADNIFTALCFNLLAGTVHSEIQAAHRKKGGITRLFPRMYEADKNALRACLDSTPEELRKGWERHVASKKRIRAISLQALRKGIAEPSEAKASLKDAVLVWANEQDNDTLVSLPVALFDIFVQFGILAPE